MAVESENPVETAKQVYISVDVAITPDLEIQIHMDIFAVVLGIVGIILFVFALRAIRREWITTDLVVDTAEIGIPGGHKITMRPNLLDRQIAYKIWVESSTRKIGLSIDLEHDVIVEIYDSWYLFFGLTREMIKDVPASKLKQATTKQIVDISIAVLNDVLRPHLTRWQARFRHWYDNELKKEENRDIDPQEIQKRFKKYDELASELLQINDSLIHYRSELLRIATAKK